MNSSTGYKKALVIYIDILGSQNRTDFDELFKINSSFHNELIESQKQDRNYVSYQRRIYPFSDCAYLFYNYKDNIEKADRCIGTLFDVALRNCEPILMRFLNEGFVFRGGVAYGDVYFDENKSLFFGEAVNRAYIYEKRIAKYPRIVIDKFVADTITDHLRKNDKQPDDSIIKQDSDGQYYLHYLNSIQQGRDYCLIIGKNNREFIADIIAMCDRQLVSFSKDENIYSKYTWLKEYIKQSLNDLVGTPVVFQKPLYDTMFSKMLEDDECFDTIQYLSTKGIKMCMPNVGSLEDLFESFKDMNNAIERGH